MSSFFVLCLGLSSWDRLFRSVADAANVIAEFDKKGIRLVSIGEGFDMTSAYGRAMAQMASVFAELERAMIRERTRSVGLKTRLANPLEGRRAGWPKTKRRGAGSW